MAVPREETHKASLQHFRRTVLRDTIGRDLLIPTGQERIMSAEDGRACLAVCRRFGKRWGRHKPCEYGAKVRILIHQVFAIALNRGRNGFFGLVRKHKHLHRRARQHRVNLTESAQFLANPALDPDERAIWVFGLWVRLAL